jgi:hypothetical protein
MTEIKTLKQALRWLKSHGYEYSRDKDRFWTVNAGESTWNAQNRHFIPFVQDLARYVE